MARPGERGHRARARAHLDERLDGVEGGEVDERVTGEGEERGTGKSRAGQARKSKRGHRGRGSLRSKNEEAKGRFRQERSRAPARGAPA